MRFERVLIYLPYGFTIAGFQCHAIQNRSMPMNVTT